MCKGGNLFSKAPLKPSLNYLSEPGLCYDESVECAEFARQGKCTNREVHQYANYCKHSCALCGKCSIMLQGKYTRSAQPEKCTNMCT